MGKTPENTAGFNPDALETQRAHLQTILEDKKRALQAYILEKTLAIDPYRQAPNAEDKTADPREKKLRRDVMIAEENLILFEVNELGEIEKIPPLIISYNPAGNKARGRGGWFAPVTGSIDRAGRKWANDVAIYLFEFRDGLKKASKGQKFEAAVIGGFPISASTKSEYGNFSNDMVRASVNFANYLYDFAFHGLAKMFSGQSGIFPYNQKDDEHKKLVFSFSQNGYWVTFSTETYGENPKLGKIVVSMERVTMPTDTQ